MSMPRRALRLAAGAVVRGIVSIPLALNGVVVAGGQTGKTFGISISILKVKFNLMETAKGFKDLSGLGRLKGASLMGGMAAIGADGAAATGKAGGEGCAGL